MFLILVILLYIIYTIRYIKNYYAKFHVYAYILNNNIIILYIFNT